MLNPLWCYHGFRMAVAVLTVIGLVMVYSSSAATTAASGGDPTTDLLEQGLFCVGGLALGLICAMLPLSIYRRIGFVLVLASMFLQTLTFTALGRSKNGNSGWIFVAGHSFQPAEAMKLALCIWLPAALLAAAARARKVGWPKAYALPLAMFVACLLLVLGGKDLGTAIIIIFIGGAAFLIGGFPGKWLGLGAIVMGAAVTGLIMASPSRRNRILATYVGCSGDDAQGICFQATHARYAMASGGFLGLGLGNSREKWSYLPEAHNDFIFAIIGEELGFLGCAAVILLFVVIGWCLIRVALAIADRYASMVLMTLDVWIVGQALVNIGVVVGVFPVFGVPMPFVSAGGSSLVMCLAGAGVAIGMMRRQPEIKADSSRE
ncbi:FtsW/RodA/SpoVE family cell cycle protein [Bifidobacterium pullorum subsp. saeculare]|uniref:Probable peptidoglycan glycosyltransferase FtsW n=1 Tax=Bifidobacterium pullorum subsp. saeculare TaxID=78257 RepID=A0A938WWL6_9BIFI|nr:FtsW/RodA/SpoVE family cell cycle protein [Bifidobacterium pullorum subsp. saeculare]